ncbi:MAG: tetratricopeptide repeat protein [Deltaproteobacteria bacterium]|nr:tetratricopeptide repeat protein [Deltaproteobacteria bacterium]
MKRRAHARTHDPEATLERGVAHHRAGRLEEAGRAYDAVLSRAPRMAAALAMKGLLGLQRGQLDDAISLLERALAIDPDDASSWSNLGHALKRAGRLEDAITACRRAVALEPRRAGAHNNLGNALRERGDLADAEAAFREALAIDPRLFAAAANLAHVTARRDVSTLDEILSQIDRAIGLADRAHPSDHADLHNLRGNVLRRSGDSTSAIASYRAAIAIEPSFAEALLNLGRALARELALEEAVVPLERGLALRPTEHAVYPQLALVLRRLGREAAAAEVYRAWHLQVPDDPVAAHLAASSGHASREAAPSRASAEYVRREFDGFAETFDEVLVTRLDYRGPQLVAEAIARVGLTAGASLDVLDAGCGTGLAAPHLRPLSRRLVGVDLSAAMLRQAATRGYDALIEADLLDHAATAREAYDLVAATEVLLYFGDLAGVLAALAATLRASGRFVLTVEAAESDVETWTLGPSGRYAHTRDYLARELERTALSIESIESVVLRRELGVDVRGWLATARR